MAARLVNRMRGPQPQSLSPREVAVLTLVAVGRTNAEIGRELHIAEAMVEAHLVRTFPELDVSFRTGVEIARERGLSQ